MDSVFGNKQPAKRQISLALAVLFIWGIAPQAQAVSPPSAQEQRFIAAQCAPLLGKGNAQHMFQLAKVLVQSQGMRLVTQACPFVRTASGAMEQVLDIRVLVVDSDTASQFVRGPLADREEVDMGAVHFALPSLSQGVTVEQGEDVSPDVQFNRHWLAGVMLQRGWQVLPAHWWAFVPTAKR